MKRCALVVLASIVALSAACVGPRTKNELTLLQRCNKDTAVDGTECRDTNAGTLR